MAIKPTKRSTLVEEGKCVTARAGFALVVALGLFVAVLFYVLPLLSKLPGYLETNGLKSLLDQGMVILAKVLAVGGK
jgi:hypothetical protein